MPRLIGTAGQVDHGKPALIRALVGWDDERFPDGPNPGKPIDLDLPPHGRVSLVELPSDPRDLTTRRGRPLEIEVALWIVAGEAGVGSSTREQLIILDRLPIDRLVVALLYDDYDDGNPADLTWLLGHGRYGNAAIIPVDRDSGAGLPDLRRALAAALPRQFTDHDRLEAILGMVAQRPLGCPTEDVCRRLNLPLEAVGDDFERLKREGRLLGFAGQWWIPEAWRAGADRLLAALHELHARYPGQAGLAREGVLREASLGWSGKPLDRMLAHLAGEGLLVLRDNDLALPTFRVTLTERQVALLDRVIEAIGAEAIDPPGPKDLARAVAVPLPAITEILTLGERSGRLVRIAEDLVVPETAVGRVRSMLQSLGVHGRAFTAAEFRDALDTSRRVAIPWLEWCDEQGITQRRGESRVLNNRP